MFIPEILGQEVLINTHIWQLRWMFEWFFGRHTRSSMAPWFWEVCSLRKIPTRLQPGFWSAKRGYIFTLPADTGYISRFWWSKLHQFGSMLDNAFFCKGQILFQRYELVVAQFGQGDFRSTRHSIIFPTQKKLAKTLRFASVYSSLSTLWLASVYISLSIMNTSIKCH